MRTIRMFAAAAVILVITALTACGSKPGPGAQAPAAQEPAGGQTAAEEAAAQEPAGGQTADEEPTSSLSVAAVSRSIGELWLLAGGELAGMTEDGMDLEGITENTQVIGTVTNPSLEAIAALSPDMVLLSGELPTHKKLAEQLDAREIPTRMISVNSFSDYDDIMHELTDLTGREDCYQTYVTDVKGRIDEVLASEAAQNMKKGTYLALRVSATKNKALKDDYFACEIFDAFGLENIAQDNSALDELNLEAILDADPDMIFVIEQGKSDEAQDSFEKNFAAKPVWKELKAVQNGCVYTLPKEYFQYKPNARWDEAYLYVCELLQE